MNALEKILRESASRHKHLCPRQVLGARMAVHAAEVLHLDLPRSDKRLLIIAETDGCFVDGLIAAAGCHVGGRTLRILDFGKVAAIFIDTYTEKAVRLAPGPESRSLARGYAPLAPSQWQAMLTGYKIMPAQELLCSQEVQLNFSIMEIISKPSKKAECEICHEEIINGREVDRDGSTLCRSCAGENYYELASAPERLTER